MGWKSKFLFLLIIYFSGFATAIYYLSPAGENLTNGRSSIQDGSQDVQESSMAGGKTMDNFSYEAKRAYNKIAAKLSSMSKEDFKAAYEKGLAALKNMQHTEENTNQKSEDN